MYDIMDSEISLFEHKRHIEFDHWTISFGLEAAPSKEVFLANSHAN